MLSGLLQLLEPLVQIRETVLEQHVWCIVDKKHIPDLCNTQGTPMELVDDDDGWVKV